MKLTEAQKLEKLREAYYDPKMGLGSVDKLYRKLRSSGITRKEVGTFIKKQQVHQEHLQQRKPSYYPIYSVVDGSYQADLVFYPKFKTINNGATIRF